MKRLLFSFACIASMACGSAPPKPPSHRADPPPAVAGTPRTLEEGMRAKRLDPVTLRLVSRTMTSRLDTAPTVRGGTLIVLESAGWNAWPSQFARARDGRIVLVSPRPTVVVDRKVDGGCAKFAGGRAWFEEVVYELPAGVGFAGVVEVPFEKHIEQVEYTPMQPDSSPCPPPAVD